MSAHVSPGAGATMKGALALVALACEVWGPTGSCCKDDCRSPLLCPVTIEESAGPMARATGRVCGRAGRKFSGVSSQIVGNLT